MGTKTETAVARKSAKAAATSPPAAKTKSVKAPKSKKSAAPMKPRSHPPYIEVIPKISIYIARIDYFVQLRSDLFVEWLN